MTTNTDPEIVDAEIVEPLAPNGPTTAQVVAVPPTSALVEPVADLDTIARAYDAYEAVCERLLKPSDYQEIGRGRRFVKKSGWRKLAVAMGVSVELLTIESERNGDGRIVRTTVTARATAPNGRSMDGLGLCSIDEDRFHGQVGMRTDHDIPSTAATRATNRACADLFGFGAVSAEEMQGGGGWYGGEYDEPMENVRRSSTSSTAPAAGTASPKQVKMLRTRLTLAFKEHGLDPKVVGETYRPRGWTDAGLPPKANGVLKRDVDKALELIATAHASGDFETVEPEPAPDVSSADPGFGAGIAPDVTLPPRCRVTDCEHPAVEGHDGYCLDHETM